MPRKFDFVSPGVQITEIDQSKMEPALEDDGLLIIGRARSGPANKPIKVNSLDNFIDIFGKPISGKGTINDDVWRDGNNQGPTYGAYAAQAWLASETSPVTFVRLLGQDNATKLGSYVYAGWENGGALFGAKPPDNGTAYGLYIMASSSAAVTGTLAAILYTTGSGLTLSGSRAGSNGGATEITSSAVEMIESLASAPKPGTFALELSDAISGYGPTEKLIFHFDPAEKQGFIRNVLNTNPQLVDSTNYGASATKKYWLGETFEEAVSRLVTNPSNVAANAGDQFAILLPLQNQGNADQNLMYHRAEAAAPKSGWVINRDPSPQDSVEDYNPAAMDKLFRLVSHSEGEWFQNNYYITIENLKLGTVKNPNSTFTLCIRNLAGDKVEEFGNLNLDQSSENFIGKKIGTQYQTWDTATERYELFGDYPNNSNYVYVELGDLDAISDAYKIPFGFHGPVAPKGFSMSTGSAGPMAYGSDAGAASALTTLHVTGGNTSIPMNGINGLGSVGVKTTNFFAAPLATHITGAFKHPRLKLSEENTSRGGVNYKGNDMFGLNHKMANTNTRNVYDDRSYLDIIRYLGGGIDLHTTDSKTEYSFVFSLDDINETSPGSGAFYWASGSHATAPASSLSVTAGSGSQSLLDKNVRQFAMPMFGGFDGLDVTKVDPFANGILSGKAANTHYAYASIERSIKSVSDSEAVQYDVISIPGLYNEALTNELIDTVEDRGDALALVDLDDGYQESYETGTGAAAGGSVASVLANARSRDYNTSYAATHFPRVRMRDTLSGNGDIFVAPASVAAAGALAYSDANSEGPWFAPAGFNRGGISILGGNDGPRVIGTWKNLPKADRDELYELNINPIARFPAVGEIVVFGQKTLQQTPSALDRINVRRLMVYLKKRIGKIADTILFDQNVQATWSRFKSQADLLLGDVQSRFGISEYKLVLDETTTTPDLIDQNIMYAKIFVKPARAIEFIAIDFIITRSGVQF